MILELDMGNTRIKWRVRHESGKVFRGSMLSKAPWGTLAQEVASILSDYDHNYALARVLVASVLGESRNQDFRNWCESEYAISPEFAKSEPVTHGVVNGYKTPGQLGVDRWLAIMAGYEAVHQACVIVDCGSALTVDLVDRQGLHLGGYIAPGVQLMRRALRLDTAGVGVGDDVLLSATEPGQDTENAVSAAQAAMICGLLERAVECLRRRVGSSPIALVITGGDAQSLLVHFPEALWVPELVLDGLVLALPAP